MCVTCSSGDLAFHRSDRMMTAPNGFNIDKAAPNREKLENHSSLKMGGRVF